MPVLLLKRSWEKCDLGSCAESQLESSLLWECRHGSTGSSNWRRLKELGAGIGRISETLIGSVEGINDAGRKKWLTKVQLLGSAIMRRLSKARFMLRMKRATRSYLSCSFDVNLLNLRRGGLKYRNFQYTL